MRIVADTNVIVSAFLWGGTPRRLLDAIEAQRLELFTSRALIAELEEVLLRAKFSERLGQTRFTPAFLLARYSQLATLIAPAELTVSELRDPDDTAVFACALAEGRKDRLEARVRRAGSAADLSAAVVLSRLLQICRWADERKS